MHELVGSFLFILTTIDPIGTLTLFVGMTAGRSAGERRRIALRAIGYSAAVLVSALVVGQVLLGSLGIRLAAFELAGGIIFFLFGVQMVFGTGAAEIPAEPEPGHDVAVFPLAVPSIASPGSILAVMILTDNRVFSVKEQAITTCLLLVLLALTLALLLQADRVHRWLGASGSSLLVKVMGLLLTSLAVEMILAAAVELAQDFAAA